MSNAAIMLQRLRDSQQFYAAKCLKILSKDGKIIPFIYNSAQLYMDMKLREQYSKVGFIRAVIVKGRQQGLSTKTEGNYFHDTQFYPNRNAFILTHHSESSDHLFGMVKRFYDNLPPPLQEPPIKRNEDEFIFANNSQYAVGTARSGQIGRGRTLQLFHGSEVAYWENSAQLAKGVLNAIADVAGTSIIFESTSNGPGDYFHSRAMQAQVATDPRDFQLIFIPWFWQPEYTRPTGGFILDGEEADLLRRYESIGMTIAHLAWRRYKIESSVIGGDVEAAVLDFKREYPNDIDEAFESTGRRFFSPETINAGARRWKDRAKAEKPYGAKILGIDGGRAGDPTGFCLRHGRRIEKIWELTNMDSMRLAGIVIKLIQTEDLDMVFFDAAHGYGAYDRCVELGWGRYVQLVHFNEGATHKERWRNKRSEMHGDFRDWLAEEDGELPDDPGLITEMRSVPEEKQTSNGINYVVDKDEIKKVLGRSPNKLDATILTFAYPVRAKKRNEEYAASSIISSRGSQSLLDKRLQKR